jgi:hypothetical protein
VGSLRAKGVRSRRHVSLVLLTVVAVAVGALAACGERTPESESQTGETGRVTLVIGSRLGQGAFEVRYEVDPATAASLLYPPVGLSLNQDGRRIHLLVVGPHPAVLGPNPPWDLPTARPTGTGPFQYALPELTPGEYEVCATGHIGHPTDGEPFTACRAFEFAA